MTGQAWPYERRQQALAAAGRILRGEARAGDDRLVAEATLHYGSLPNRSLTIPRWDHEAKERRRLERRAKLLARGHGRPIQWCVPCRHAGPGAPHRCQSPNLCPCRHCDPRKPLGPPGSVTCLVARYGNEKGAVLPWQARCLVCGRTDEFKAKRGPQELQANLARLGYENVTPSDGTTHSRAVWAHLACVDALLAQPEEAET